MRRVNHPDFFDADLPRIEAEIGDDARFEEFLACLDKAVLEIAKDPNREGAPLTRPPLDTYRKKKFHSRLTPRRGASADMRLVYRYDEAADILYVLGVGKRLPLEESDVYTLLAPRSI